MNLKKILTMGLTLTLLASMTACTFGGETEVNKPISTVATIDEVKPKDDVDVETDKDNDKDKDNTQTGAEDIKEISVTPKYYKGKISNDVYGEGDSLLSRVSYNSIFLDYDQSMMDEFAPLTKALDEYHKDVNKQLEAIHDYFVENQPEEVYFEEGTYDESIDYLVRGDKEVLSFVTINESYYGGTMFDVLSYGHNYDITTGEEIKLEDVVTVDDKFAENLAEYLSENYPEGTYGLSVDDIKGRIEENFMEETDKFNFNITNTGLVIYFNVYSLGTPRAAGSFEVVIDYKDSDYKFADKYFTNYGGFYTQEMIPNHEYNINGNALYMWINIDKYAEFAYRDVNFISGSDFMNEYSYDCPSLECPQVYMVTIGDNTYIYYQISNYDCLDTFYTFCFDGENVDLWDIQYGSIISMLDLANIELWMNIDCLTYISARGNCFINDIGVISPYDYLEFDCDWCYYEVKKEMPIDKITDFDRMSTESSVLEVGTKLTPQYYDSISDKIIFVDEDGNQYVLSLTDYDYYEYLEVVEIW